MPYLDPSRIGPWIVGRVRDVLSTFFLLSLALALSGCDLNDDGTSATAALACSPVASISSAQPGQEIMVTGIPDHFIDMTVEVTAAGVPSAYTNARRVEGAGVAVATPFSPASVRNGGPVELTISSGSETCRAIAMMVEPLVAAPQAVQALADELDTLLTQWTALFGLTPADLQGDPALLPPEALPLVLAVAMLDHPDNPNSLRAILDGTAPLLQDSAVDRDTIGALLVNSGALQALQELNATLFASVEPQSLRVAAAQSQSAPTGARTMHPMLVRAVRIETAADLNYWMGVRQRIEWSQATAEDVLSKLGIGMGALMLIPGLDVITTATGAVASLFVYVTTVVMDGLKATLPAEVTGFYVETSPTSFNEDSPLTGRWGNAQLTVRGGEWIFGWPRLADGVLMGQGAATTGVLKRVIKNLPEQVVTETLSNIGNWVYSTMNAVLGMVKPNATASYNDGGFYAAGPFTYGPIAVDDLKYFNVYTTDARVVELLASDKHAYRPVGPGSTTLVIRTKPEVFSNVRAEVTREITVNALTVSVDPATAQVRPGRTLTFMAAVGGADDPSVTWSVSAGGGSIVPDGGGFALYTAPAQEGTFTITARSATRPARYGTATVTVKDSVIVNLSPTTAQLQPGATRSFTATVEGNANTAVNWSASGGNVTVNGNSATFSADVEGTYHLVATSQADPTAQAAATITVSQPTYGAVELPSGFTPFDLSDTGQVVGHTSGEVAVWDNGTLTTVLAIGGVYQGLTIGAFYHASINALGQVAGTVALRDSGGNYVDVRAFVWQAGALTDLGPAFSHIAFNEAGQVLGQENVSGGAFKIWTNGSFATTQRGSRILNNLGQTAGEYSAPTTGENQPFFWSAGTTTDIAALGRQVCDFNDSGVVLLNDGSLWQSGTITVMDGYTPVNCYRSWSANGRVLNNQGQVLVNGSDGPYLWHNGTATPIANSAPPSFATLYSYSPRFLNNSGQILFEASKTWDALGPTYYLVSPPP